MSGQASPTAEDMPGSELQENSGVRETSRQCTLHPSVTGVRPGLGVFQPVHSISRDETTDAHGGIYLPPIPPKAPAPLVAMQPEAIPQLF
ncbi:expressed unknown protein [Ectocarpus siliculosus]|uniref:Uncharacterized protein n=1 Tax=Ectocarpus siliculosus TaxID=2880 RepID=D7G8Z8_ECTSI|nr:expressed unknown protein [Ectocarpus siliculosus]|eukprot:CBJ28159.1 expressed unknown protein [Ectocarpus siliculosus]